MRRVVVLLIVAAFASPLAAATLSPERQREILASALQAYDDASKASRTNQSMAQAEYREAAAAFEALVAGGVRNPLLYYNLGNAYYRLGDLGRAVVNYRRASLLSPDHPLIESNLRYVRERVEPAIVDSGRAQLARTVFFWHYGAALETRYVVATAASLVGWALLIAWLRWRRTSIAVAGLCGVAIAVAAGLSVLYDLSERETRPEAVVVDRQLLRLGRGESAEPALQQPLGPGIEVKVLQRRGDWVEVRLLNDLTGWLPISALEMV